MDKPIGDMRWAWPTAKIIMTDNQPQKKTYLQQAYWNLLLTGASQTPKDIKAMKLFFYLIIPVFTLLIGTFFISNFSDASILANIFLGTLTCGGAFGLICLHLQLKGYRNRDNYKEEEWTYLNHKPLHFAKVARMSLLVGLGGALFSRWS